MNIVRFMGRYINTDNIISIGEVSWAEDAIGGHILRCSVELAMRDNPMWFIFKTSPERIIEDEERKKFEEEAWGKCDNPFITQYETVDGKWINGFQATHFDYDETDMPKCELRARKLVDELIKEWGGVPAKIKTIEERNVE